ARKNTPSPLPQPISRIRSGLSGRWRTAAASAVSDGEGIGSIIPTLTPRRTCRRGRGPYKDLVTGTSVSFRISRRGGLSGSRQVDCAGCLRADRGGRRRGDPDRSQRGGGGGRRGAGGGP